MITFLVRHNAPPLMFFYLRGGGTKNTARKGGSRKSKGKEERGKRKDERGKRKEGRGKRERRG